MFSTILSISGGILAGVIVGLKVLAPRTSTRVDDELLKYAEKLERILHLIPGGAEAAATAKAEAKAEVKTSTSASGVVTRDHR